ncbi:beta-N-acetylhexosaminidase [Puteibacter caeruleilacunae]|nr:beta-N-acetylhexosaminidase [Puteibacter caeruleilacunae]
MKRFWNYLLILFFICIISLGASAQDTRSTAQREDKALFKAKFSSEELNAAPVKLMPYPQKVKWGTSQKKLKQIRLVNVAQLNNSVEEEIQAIVKSSGIKVSDKANYYLEFKHDKELGEEAYDLKVTSDGIIVSASTSKGQYYALQTVRQLINIDGKSVHIQSCEIEDEPAFGIRGFMIDVGRNFQSMESLKNLLDIMALYKLNVFHWHLTDRPAWRIESKSYPQLTKAENHRATRDPGMYYTYDEIRELIAYAATKNITVVPEIDMPGHSDSFRTAMGVRMESAEGMIILENILLEFFKEIPIEMAPMIHIGSDEVHIKNPKEFIEKMAGIVEENGRSVIVWSPGLEAPNSVIRQTWGSADAVQGAFQEIDSRRSYVNSGEPMSNVNNLLFKPIGADSNNKTIGGIICHWPDVNIENEQDAFRQNPVYSSLLTYAWATWTADVISAPRKYRMQLPEKGTEAAAYFNAFESFLISHKESQFSDLPFFYHAQSDKEWELIGPFKGDDGDSILMAGDNYSYMYNGKPVEWFPVRGNTLMLRTRWTREGYFAKEKANATVYARTFVYSDKRKEVPAWIGFETPMRANRIYTGIAENGEWDINGGLIMVNGQKLIGPKWQNPGWKTEKQSGWGTPKDQEIPWADEELYWLREPATITFNKGWNEVLVKIPCTTDYQNWMFTFVPLDMKGLKFSTSPEN